MIDLPPVIELGPDELCAANDVYRTIGFWPSDPRSARTFAMHGNDDLVALGRLRTHADGALELGGIWTAERWRRRGLAHRMVTALLDEVPKARPVHCIAVATIAGLYRGLGFAEPRDAIPSSIAANVEAARRVHPATLLVRRR